MIRCKMCHQNKPDHLTETVWDNGKKIVVCQDCLPVEEDTKLLGRFSIISQINYNKFMEVQNSVF